MIKEYNFEVEIKESGQRAKYGDSYYHFIVKNKCDVNYADHVVKDFCTGFLKKAYEPEQMPNAFSPKIVLFHKIADRTYEYKVEELSTH